MTTKKMKNTRRRLMPGESLKNFARLQAAGPDGHALTIACRTWLARKGRSR